MNPHLNYWLFLQVKGIRIIRMIIKSLEKIFTQSKQQSIIIIKYRDAIFSKITSERNYYSAVGERVTCLNVSVIYCNMFVSV